MEYSRGRYIITDDLDRVDLDVVMKLLAQSYWASNRTRQQMSKAIPNSVCFSLYLHEEQIGFARAVTDRSTFAWICDVIVDPEYRGQGLGMWLMEVVTEHPTIAGLQQVLKTRDAHELYERFGFERSEYLRRRSRTIAD